MSQQIVIIGSGFAGMYSALAARRLIAQSAEANPPRVIVISPSPTLHVRPRLYEYESDENTFTAPLKDLFKATGVNHISGFADTIDTQKQEVNVKLLDSQSKVRYDRLILASGSQLVHPDVPGLIEYGFDIDQVSGAQKLQAHLQHLAAQANTATRNTFLICGAGFTGIELATELPSRIASLFGADAKQSRIILIDRNETVGSQLGPGPRPAIVSVLESLNVELMLGTSVASISPSSVTTTDGQVIASNTIIWTGGMKASSLTDQIASPKDNLSRLVVDSNLRVPSIPTVFATGDVAHAATDNQGNTALMSCQHALILGRVSGHNAAADLLGLPLHQYSQPAYGTCLSLGPGKAVVTQGWDREVVYLGKQAKFVKDYINTQLIYPPPAVADEAFTVADPDFKIPPLEPPADLAIEA